MENIIHAVICIRISILFKTENNIPPVRTYHILFIHSSVDGHSGYFYLLAMVNNAAMSMGMANTCSRPCFQLFCYVPKSGWTTWQLYFRFFRDYYSVSHSSCTTLHFHQHDAKSWTRLSDWAATAISTTEVCRFLHSLANTCYFLGLLLLFL